jgi:uncharacterized membrane protein YeaQ/YmgE (transglycosylase-associated protein family)
MVADISFIHAVWYVIAGLVIGLLARLLLPGRQSMGILMTMVLGVVSALIGGYLWELIFSNHGIAWIGSVLVAVVILWAYERIAASRSAKPGAPGSSAAS